MGNSKVKEFFKEKGLEDRFMELGESSATVALAAKAIGCEENQIAKTISLLVSGEPVLVVCAGDTKINSSKFKEQFKEKAKMIPAPDVLPMIGHDVGGVCPFAVNEGVKIYLDASLKKNTIVYPAGGSPHSVVKVSVEELAELVGADSFIEVTKKREE